jgi:hypothetical protein
MNIKQINWFALISGILVLFLIPISIYFPWWQLVIGQNLLAVNASPVNTHFNLMGTALSSSLVWAMNLTGILTFLASGIILLIYGLIPTKPYSIDLLSFAYRKPLYTVLLYLVALIIMTVATQAILGKGLPINGTSTLIVPSNLTMGITISVLVSSAFQWPFWLAIATAALCIVARIYHTKLTKSAQAIASQITSTNQATKTK